MAAILELLLAKEVLPAEVICWLTRKYDTGTCPPMLQPGVLQDHSNLRDEFVPYFLNLLRDDSLHLLQATRSTNSTPAKTPLSMKLGKSSGIHRMESRADVSMPVASRTQLFSSPDVSGGHNRTPIWKQLPGAVFESPQLTDSGGRNKGRNAAKSSQQRRRSSPFTDLAHTESGSLHKPDAHRSQHRHDLSAYFSVAELEQRLKHHQQSDAKDDCSPQSYSGRRPGNKKRRSYPSGDKRKQQTVNAETPAPVFSLVDNIAFPSLADGDHPTQDRTATIVPRPPGDASLPKGTKVITRSRRVATTIVTPSRKTEVTNNIFLNAPTVTKGSPEGAATCWGDGNPAKFFSSNLEKRLIGKVTKTDKVDTRNDRQTDMGAEQLDEGSDQTLTTVADRCSGQPVSSPLGVTPVKSQIGRSVSVTEWVTADRTLVTHEDRLCLMADVYSGFLHENLVPNLTVELYFVVQLLTARSAESPTRSPSKDSQEVHHFDTVHNTVYFAVTVLALHTSLLSVLDRGTLRLLADNRNIANFSPELKEHLNRLYRDCPARPLPLTSSCLSPVGGVSFQADTDNRKNFPTDRVFHLFKKQRDLFYELIRDWQECHMTPGWNMLETQGEKIRHLVGYRTELANHIHFARLFQSQLIQMCTGERSLAGGQEAEEAEKVALLSELKQTNPDKFKRLQERFVMPSSLGLPCPPASFPGWQEFFRDFIVAAASHVFNQHLLNTLATRVAQLNSMQFNSVAEDGRFDEAEEDGVSFIKCVSTLRLLGKYLGFVAFLPYQTPDLLPDSVQEAYVCMRDHSQPVDVLHYVETALCTGRTIVTLPWVLEYLSMADPLAPRLSYFNQLFRRLLVVHRLASEWFQQHQSHNALLLLLILGWLFQLPVFPEALFFSGVRGKADTALMAAGTLDATATVNQSLVSICCPYLGEIRVLLVDFAVGINSCSHNIRKITPVLTEPPAPSAVTDLQLQQQMEENFFSNHPASLKRTVEFVADRIASNFIKRFRAHTFPAMLEAGYDWVKELVRNTDDDVFSKRAKEKLLYQLQEYSGRTADSSHSCTRQEARGYCTEKAATILHTLLPEETPTTVLKVATSIVERISGVKICAWMTTHVTHNMLRREFVTALDKQLKTLKISRNACMDHIGVAMMTPAERSKAPPGVCTERKLTHDETFEAPADVVIRFKGVLSRFMLQPEPGVDAETLCDTLQITQDVLNNRQDIIPGVYRALAKMSVDLAYVLVLKHPHMWQDDVERHLVALWKTHLWEHSLFHNVVCPKHMYLIRESENPKACWQKLTELTLCLLRSDIVRPEQLEPGLLRVLATALTPAEMKDVTVYVCTVAEFFHALHHGRTNEEFLCVLDALHTVCVDHGLERAQAAVQHCIDSINSTQGTVTGSSTAGSSAGGIITGRSSHLSPKEIDCCITTSEPVSSTAEHHCGGTGDTDHCCKEVRIKTDHCSNDVTDNDHCCSVVRETDRCCNEVTSSPVRGSIHLLHDNTSYAGSSHCHTPTGTVSVGHCDSSLTDPPTYAPVTERTLVIDTNRTVNSSECGSEYISRLRIHDQNDTADHKNIHLPGDPGLSPHTEASGEGTTALLDGNDTSRIRSALVEDSVCSDACDTSTVCSQLELEAVVHPVCT